MKTLRKVFAIVGTSVLLGGFLMFFIYAIVGNADALNQFGAAAETARKGGSEVLAKAYEKLMFPPIMSMVFGMLGAAAAITFGIIFLVKYARRTFPNPQRQLVFGLLFKQIFAFAAIMVCMFAVIATGVFNDAFKNFSGFEKQKVEAMPIVEMVFWFLALGAVITGEILHKYHRFAAKITLGSGVGVMSVCAILMMCEKDVHALAIVSGIFLLIGFGLFSAYYILPEPRPGAAPRPRPVYDEYGYEVRPTQPRPQTAPRPAPRFDDIPIEEEPVKPAPKPVQQQPAPQPKPQPVQNNGGVDVTKELQKLKNLLDAGVITKEEYDAKRKKYIDML